MRTGGALSHHLLGYNQKENQENDHIILLFFGWNTFCWAGVEAKLELESQSIFPVGIRSRSRFKFVDSAALPVIIAKQRKNDHYLDIFL